MARRTSKHFDGVQNPGKKIGEMLPQLLQEISQKKGDPVEEVFQEWYVVIGKKMAPFTEPVSLHNGVLTVKVKSSTLYNLLCQHEKIPLLRQLQKKFPLKDLLFRAG